MINKNKIRNKMTMYLEYVDNLSSKKRKAAKVGEILLIGVLFFGGIAAIVVEFKVDNLSIGELVGLSCFGVISSLSALFIWLVVLERICGRSSDSSNNLSLKSHVSIEYTEIEGDKGRMQVASIQERRKQEIRKFIPERKQGSRYV